MLATLTGVRDAVAAMMEPGSAWTVRVVHQNDDVVSVRRDVPDPLASGDDLGVMVSVAAYAGVGFAATADLSESGLRAAVEAAYGWAARMGSAGIPGAATLPQPDRGTYESVVRIPWHNQPIGDTLARLVALSQDLSGGDEIVDWGASLWRTSVDCLVSGSQGGETQQHFEYLVPNLSATASAAGDSQTRTFGGHAYTRQGGLEVLDDIGFWSAGERVRQEALELLGAANCPSGPTDLVLAPDQMILQIHESIGHPLELDRILGDERNYAGSSFVTAEMFGSYRYGSADLNITFDPGVAGEFASYGFDDEGQRAERVELIRAGLLLRGLGGSRSQKRSGLAGVANARAAGWNRPPIDRMANLNLEPGNLSFEELIGAVEDGIFMETNRSWSIDDSRNKFQFGCERARRIRDGSLGEVVKNPNYRGMSATFWRSLDGVGNRATVEMLGTPFCGKGEPNQVIRVGHASPVCRFRRVDVFGGE